MSLAQEFVFATETNCFDISIEDDDIYEDSETFQISVTTPTDPAVDINGPPLELAILDDDSMSCV